MPNPFGNIAIRSERDSARGQRSRTLAFSRVQRIGSLEGKRAEWFRSIFRSYRERHAPGLVRQCNETGVYLAGIDETVVNVESSDIGSILLPEGLCQDDAGSIRIGREPVDFVGERENIFRRGAIVRLRLLMRSAQIEIQCNDLRIEICNFRNQAGQVGSRNGRSAARKIVARFPIIRIVDKENGGTWFWGSNARDHVLHRAVALISQRQEKVFLLEVRL